MKKKTVLILFLTAVLVMLQAVPAAFADGSLTEAFAEKYGRYGEAAMKDLRGIVWPDFMKTPGTPLSAWLPPEERPEIAAVSELTFEDGVLSLTMDRKVENIDVLEYPPNQDYNLVYSSCNDTDNANRDTNATVRLVNPQKDHVNIVIEELIRVNGKDYDTTQRFNLSVSPLKLEPTETRTMFPLEGKDIPPYEKFQRPQLQRYVCWRGDGSVSGIEYFLCPSAILLDVTLDIGKDGQAEGCIVYQSTFQRDWEFSTEVRAERETGITQMAFYASDDTYMHIQLLDKEYLEYYRTKIRETYPKAKFFKKGLKIWMYSCLLAGKGTSDQFFLTTDDLFLIDETGAVHLNEAARDENGNPFSATEMMEFLSPEICSIPLVW